MRESQTSEIFMKMYGIICMGINSSTPWESSTFAVGEEEARPVELRGEMEAMKVVTAALRVVKDQV